MEPDDQSISALMRVLKNRARPAAIASFAVLLVMTGIVFGLPAVYESSASLLIEQPNLPPELLGGADAQEYVEQRLQRTRQWVLNADNVKAIIDRHKLYQTDDNTIPVEDMLALFNANVIVTPQVTGVIDPRSMRTADLTYAFDVAFRYADPNIAHAVASDLSELFISSSAKQAKEDAERAMTFSRSEADRLATELRAREGRLAEFQQKHPGGGLPEDRARNLQRVSDLERDLARVDDDLRAARAQKDLLQTQLYNTPRDSPVLDETGQVVIRGVDRLAAAQQELVAALAKYSEDHPDVRRLRREIASLTAEVSTGSSANPTNPAFLQLQTQVNAADVEVRALSARRNEISSTRAHVQGSIFQSPEYEKQYTELVRDYEMIKTQYEQMRARQSTAELAMKATGAAAAETYVLINPARVPEEPVEPDRVALMFLAMVLATAAGLGTPFLLNALDSTIRGSSDVAAISGSPPLGSIPMMRTASELRKRRLVDIGLAIGMIAAVLIVLFVVAL